MKPAIVLISAKNAAGWIAGAVGEMREQGFSVIVLDNGSGDDTAQIAQRSGAEVLKFSRDVSVGDAFKHGFSYAKKAHGEVERFIIFEMMRDEGPERTARFLKGAHAERSFIIRAPLLSWPSILIAFAVAYIRPKHLFVFAHSALPVLFALGFAAALFGQINRSLDNVRPPVFRTGQSGLVSQERIRALGWLSRHSPDNAVVMADQFDGNYIVALAGRRVVSSSKVYPSEAEEVSARYTDISRFFFATDEETALSIAEKYGVDYVLIAADFSYAKNCKLANACHFIASGELTPVGRKMSMIGKFLGREPFENFELVWDSPAFSIFRIRNDRTFRNPCWLTEEEKAVALRIARGSVDTLPQECAVSVSVYRDGLRSDPAVASGERLDRAIREAAAAIPLDASSAGRIQIAVWSEEELVRHDIRNFRNFLERRFDATKVLVMEREGKRAVFLPDEFNLRMFDSNTEILDMLCDTFGFGADCWRTETKIFVAPVTMFVEDGNGGVLPISGTLPVAAEVNEFRDRVFRERLRASRNWIWRMRTDTGDFRNEIDPHSPRATPDDTRLATLHGAAETWWLLEFHRALPADGPEIIPFAKMQSERFERLINSGEEERTAFLVYAGLENLSLWRITREPLYLERASRYADIVRQLFVDKANLASSFRMRGDAPEIISSKSVGTIGNNSGLYFLAETLREKENPAIRDAMTKFARALQYNFRKNRILNPNISIVWESWLVNAFASVSAVTQSRSDAEFALEVANWILDYQSRDMHPHLRGAFRGRAATSGVGKITEALVEAAILAEKIGEDPEPFVKGFREAMRWLMTVQYSDASYFLSAANRREMTGALRSGLTDITAEIDNAGHFVIAGAWYLSRLNDE